LVDTSLGGVRVVRELERLAFELAAPQVVVSDAETGVRSQVMLARAVEPTEEFQSLAIALPELSLFRALPTFKENRVSPVRR